MSILIHYFGWDLKKPKRFGWMNAGQAGGGGEGGQQFSLVNAARQKDASFDY